MKQRLSFLLSCFLFIFLASSFGKQKEFNGQVLDRDALKEVKSFCVDTTFLKEDEAGGIKAFVQTENRPTALLGEVPWKIVTDCANADAIVRIYFLRGVLEISNVSMLGNPTDAPMYHYRKREDVLQPVLLVYDPSSVRLLYRSEGKTKGKKRESLLQSSFADLILDLNTIQPSGQNIALAKKVKTYEKLDKIKQDRDGRLPSFGDDVVLPSQRH